jgi:hypothetical protein
VSRRKTSARKRRHQEDTFRQQDTFRWQDYVPFDPKLEGYRAAITAQPVCSLSLGQTLSGGSDIGKTTVWKKCER